MSASLPRSALLIGVDGGATQVRAHEVELASDSRSSLRLGPRSAQALHARAGDFRPLALEAQRAELDAPRLSPAEVAAGRRWIQATARCVLEVARACGARAALVGIALPGIKTLDGRGIALARNAPRVPRFLELLERLLAREGLALLAPPARLRGDGECCGLAEELAADGLFRGVRNAYYAGSGTGVAEALKLEGELASLALLADWFPRAWELRDARGELFESGLSAAGVNLAYARALGRTPDFRRGEFPEERAGEDPRAAEALARAAAVSSELLHRRLVACWQRDRNGALERIVLGQRLGAWFADARTVFGQACTRALARALAAEPAPALRALYLEPRSEELREGLVAVSRVRAAAALGAAAFELRELSGVAAP